PRRGGPRELPRQRLSHHEEPEPGGHRDLSYSGRPRCCGQCRHVSCREPLHSSLSKGRRKPPDQFKTASPSARRGLAPPRLPCALGFEYMTKAFIVGHPVKHSRSPLIHHHWLQEHGLAGSYEQVDVAPGDFVDFLKTFPERGFTGG